MEIVATTTKIGDAVMTKKNKSVSDMNNAILKALETVIDLPEHLVELELTLGLDQLPTIKAKTRIMETK